MPVESGPTLFLPYSQSFFEGYLAFGRPEFQAVFAESHVQLPLSKAMPSCSTRPDARRRQQCVSRYLAHGKSLAGLSAFGRAMESVDRDAMCKAVYPALLAARTSGALTSAEIENAIAATAEGYAFPTNLDSDPPVGGLAPKTQNTMMAEALQVGMEPEAFAALVETQAAKRRA